VTDDLTDVPAAGPDRTRRGTDRTRLELAGVQRVDELRDLWLSLHHHHRAMVGTLPLVDDDELSWRLRRALYLERLRSGTGFLVLAIDQEAVVGCALVCIEEGPDDTFPVAEPYAELYSLAVAPQLRGRGSGRACSTSLTTS
jgi:ribosomal protein S18 acetylase RimI-like enzyme